MPGLKPIEGLSTNDIHEGHNGSKKDIHEGARRTTKGHEERREGKKELQQGHDVAYSLPRMNTNKLIDELLMRG